MYISLLLSYSSPSLSFISAVEAFNERLMEDASWGANPNGGGGGSQMVDGPMHRKPDSNQVRLSSSLE